MTTVSRSRFIPLLFCLLPTLAHAVGTFIPATYRTDMVYDQPRDILYITALTNVLRYQLTNNSFLPPFQLSGSLAGIDLSPDGNTLVVADHSGPRTNVGVFVIDLKTSQSRRVSFPPEPYELGTFAVAFGRDGAALITSGFTPVPQAEQKNVGLTL